MSSNTGNNIKLGVFVSVGLLILIVALYLIGKNQSYFGSNFHVKARFKNIGGLMVGNNVRYSGIQAGTVNKIVVIDDTTIEITMLIDDKIKSHVRSNSLASIGNEGLMGNKVINIAPNSEPGAEVKDGDLLLTKKVSNTDEMLETLSSTNDNIQVISENLKNTVIRINNSAAINQLLNDTSLSSEIKRSVHAIHNTADRANEFTIALNKITADIKAGNGAAGAILSDKKLADDIKKSAENVKKITTETSFAIARIDSVVQQVQFEIAHGKNTANSILKDTAIVNKLNNSITNIEKGTSAFSENMEALKHNVLTRGYFKKQAKKNKK